MEVSRLPELGKVFLPSSVFSELEGLARTNRDANIAMKLCAGFDMVKATKNGDDGVIEAAISTGCSIITNDNDLINRAKTLGIRTFSMRSSGLIEAI